MLWLNDRLVAPEAARIDPADRGLLLGDGLFETLAVADGAPCHPARHLARLAAGCALLRLPVPARAEEAIAAVLAATGLAEGSLRLTWTRGPGPRGVLPPAPPRPTLLVTATPGAAPAGPVRLITATVTRRNEQSPLCRVKHLNYLDNILARQEAAAAGADDALLLNTAGDVAETTVANIVLRIGGRWLTPAAGSGCLPGTRRAILLEDGRAEESRLTPADLRHAEAACVTNATGIRPVSHLDGRRLSGESL
jgi:branched-chain amino acid aminotransferase